MKILVAGSNTRGAEDSCKKHGLDKLYSFYNERKEITNWDDDYFLMVDSGAHTWNKNDITKVGMKGKKKLTPASEFINTYFEYIKQHCHKKLVFVEFDVYGQLSKKVVDDFYQAVLDMNPVAKFIRVYHPILDGGSLKVLQEWVDEGHEYICIANDSLDYLDGIFNITRDKCRLHGLAMTKTTLIEKYPFYSVDSTSPLSTVIFGRYTRPVMSFNEKSDIAKMKSIECFHDDYERLENAVIETKKTQDYVTDLWKKKGIIWQDLQW